MSRSTLLPYHKGNLREKILREAARLISKHGVEAVSMRKLSARIGMSRMAAYHHFANKDDLLAAVGRDGFRRLAARLNESTAADLPALEAVRAALRAYVRFAMEETEFFRLMFTNVLERPARPATADASGAFAFSSPEAVMAFDALVSVVKRAQRDRVIRGGDPLVQANVLWVVAHGVASLAVDGHLKVRCTLEQFLNEALDTVLAGMAAPTQ